MAFLQSTRVLSWTAAASASVLGVMYQGGGLQSLGMRGIIADADAPAGALDPKAFKAFKLVEKEKLTGNTYRYRFELPDGQTSGIFTASCLVTKAMMKEKPEDEAPKAVIRPYTPTSMPDAKGYLDLVVKTYPTGKMSKHIAGLKVGDSLEMKGPIPKLAYKPNMKKSIGMVAGGTGIAPMLQIIDAVLADPTDKTELSLIFANVSEDDIILKDRLDALAAKHKNFKVYYVVDKCKNSKTWKGGVGYVTKEMMQKYLPAAGPDSMCLVCGPPPMMNSISGPKAKDFTQGEVSGLLKELNFEESMVYKF